MALTCKIIVVIPLQLHTDIMKLSCKIIVEKFNGVFFQIKIFALEKCIFPAKQSV